MRSNVARLATIDRRGGPWLASSLIMVSLFIAAASFAAAPQVFRNAPFPNYQVGQSATLTITTNPPQPNAPIYQFRDKNGQPDGAQPTLAGHTDSSGRYSIAVTVISEWIGTYTNERFAVGSPSGQQSPPLSFTISHPTSNAPVATRAAPYPNYSAGQIANLLVRTNPGQPYAPVYRFRWKNGQPDGPQPKLEGYTNGAGRFSITVPVEAEWAGNYTNERYAVGSVAGPQSAPLNFSIAAPSGTPGIFYLGDCHGCSPAESRAKAINTTQAIGAGGTYDVVLYDGENQQHSSFMILRDYEPELGIWRTLVIDEEVPQFELTDAISDYFDFLSTFESNLAPFVVNDNEEVGDKGGASRGGSDNDIPSDFDTLDLEHLGVHPTLISITEMNDQFMNALNQRLIDLGFVPTLAREGFDHIARTATTNRSIAGTEGSRVATSVEARLSAAPLLKVITGEIKGGRTETDLVAVTETDGSAIADAYERHSFIRARIRIDEEAALDDSHILVQWDGELGRFILEEASGPGGGRLPFDKLGNKIEEPEDGEISNPIVTFPEDVYWWRQYAGFFGVEFGACLPTVNFWCRLYVID